MVLGICDGSINFSATSYVLWEKGRAGFSFLLSCVGGGGGGGEMGMIIRELTAVFVLLLYGNLYIFLCSILCLYNVDIWDETLLQVMEIIHS